MKMVFMTECTNGLRYNTIVIDFPWPVSNNFDPKLVGYGRDMPYETMTYQQILDFNIDDFAADNCDLFLWVTHTTLLKGLEYLNKWNFKYHCLITWDKITGPVMLGFNRRTEMCIYGYRGKMGIKRKGRSIHTLIKEQSNNHSEKPKLFYEALTRSTQEPRIDIFSRKKHIGFDSYGNEAQEPLTLMMFDRITQQS